MIKQLLFSAAVAAMAFSASAETKVLWTSEDPAGVMADWWPPLLSLTAEQTADFKLGDVLSMTVVGVDPEIGWPQVCMFEMGVEGFDESLIKNEGVGGKEYPYIAKFPLTDDILKRVQSGVEFKDNGAYVSEIALIEATFEVGPNTIWFGPKTCGWGNGIGIDKSIFSNVVPGDKIVIEYDKAAPEHTLQLIFGDWTNGANLATYDSWQWSFYNVDEESGTINFTLTSELYNFEKEIEVNGEKVTKDYDIFSLLKNDGLQMQGPCTVNQILFLPNGQLYNKVAASMEEVEKKYEIVLAAAKEVNPTFDYTGWEEIITKAIEEAKTGAQQALESANEDNELFNFASPANDIETMIAEMELAPLKSENQKAYEAVLAEIEAVQAKYDEAVEAIEKEYPGIDLGEWKEIIGGQLAQTKAAAEQALNAANEDGEKYSFPFSAEEYDGMIAEMQKAAPNQAAYSKVMATINALQEEYDEAVETIKEVNPEFDFAYYEEIETMIADAKKGASQALAVANEDGEEFTFAYDSEQIGNFIIEMKKAAYEEHNTLAYDKVVAAIAEVEAEYTAAVAEIEKEYPGIDLSEWKEIIGGQLEIAANGAEQALAAANENGELFNFAFDGEEYEGMIEEMKKAAPNQAAYSKVIDEINAVEEEYNDAVEAIKEVNPKFDFTYYEEIETKIAEAKKYAAIALANANEDGEEFSYAFGAEDIENSIIEMKKAGFADYNQAAYDQAIADIAALEAKYDAAVVEIEETYPDYDLTEWKEIIGGDLAMAKSGAEQALAAANEDGEKFFFPVDAETFEGMIEQMKNDAKLSGIANIEAEIAAGKAKIFTLDGKAHFAPVKGQVNVIVRENSTVKVMVK